MATPRRSLVATPSAKRSVKMDIGDEVVAEVNQTRYIGVLRHLGPVHFRPGVFAGLELTGESAGKGKNDGSVDGQQYFACDPGNGMFCPALKVKPTGAAPSSDATARPQSAMSGRSSMSNDMNRPGSSLAVEDVGHFRPRSSLAAGRTPSRQSIGRPSSAMATPTPSARLPRLLPRKSVADGLADEEGRRRAKTSAEEAAKAEGRITEGSRAHRFLNMSAKDLEARRLRTSTGGPFSAAKSNSPDKAGSTNGGSNVSPLKDSLLGTSRTPKVRSSMGSALPTPTSNSGSNYKTPTAFRTAMRSSHAPPVTPKFTVKHRTTLSDMPPPPSLQSANGFPRTPSRLSVDGSGRRSATGDRANRGKGEDDEDAKRRNHTLLEQMDLLTPRHPNADLPDDTSIFGPSGTDGEACLAEAVVPLSAYEELTSEVTDLKMQVAELQRKLGSELERAKVQAQEGIRKDMEEERRIERDDEQRRRKAELQSVAEEWTAKQDAWKGTESELREKAEGALRDLKRLQDEHSRGQGDHERTVLDFESRLSEKQSLIDGLKSAAVDDGTAQAKELELKQLSERIEKLDSERSALLKEIDELKDAGQETIEIYEREQSIRDERIVELEHNMHLLEARAQEAIADAVRERDEAMSRGAGTSSVAAIDRQSLADQLEHAQKRNESLEDQLSELTSILHQEREAHVKRKDGYGDRETKLKTELARSKSLHQSAEQASRETKQRLEQLEQALEQSRSTLESERAELESLRAEAMILGDTSDETSRKALELNGLRSIVNTLNQELTEVRQRERDLRKQVDAYQNERRRWSQSSANSGGARTGVSPASAQAAVDVSGERFALEDRLRDAEAHVQELETRLADVERAKREETAKLNQDISELEALCEATVWRREEQEAQRQELERKIGKLQRQIEKLQPVPDIPTQLLQAKNGMNSIPAQPTQHVKISNDPGPEPVRTAPELRKGADTIAASAPCAECNEIGHAIDDCPFLNDDVLF